MTLTVMDSIGRTRKMSDFSRPGPAMALEFIGWCPDSI